MQSKRFLVEISKLLLTVLITALFFTLGFSIFREETYASALIGVSGGMLGVSLFQATKVFSYMKAPQKMKRDNINHKDERNLQILAHSKASSFDLETFILLGLTAYTIYTDNVGYILIIGVLWFSRIISLLYFVYKNNKTL